MVKPVVILCSILLLVVVLPAYGGDRSVRADYKARTGDTSLDTTLGNLNIQTHGRNLSDFVSNLSLSYKIPKPDLEDLLNKEKMTPADVYMTVALSKIINKPIEAVVEKYKANKGKGWGVIAKQLGIKPGSKEFKDLKKEGARQLEKVKGKSNDKEKCKNKSNKGKKDKK